MTTSNSMDVDTRTSKNGDGPVFGEIDVKVASSDAGTPSYEPSSLDTSDMSPLSKEPPLIGTAEKEKPHASTDSGSQSPPPKLATNDEPLQQLAGTEGTSDASPSPGSPGSIQDEIVCAPYYRKPLPENDPRPGSGKTEVEFRPVTPTKAQPPRRNIIIKTPDTCTTTQTKPKNGDEEAAAPLERRNPKRTASAMAQPQALKESSHDDILDETLKPIESDELEEWAGWIELESEPAFFNFILRDLGAKDVLIKEVLCLDDELIRQIPKPIHGLIFLFQYLPENWEVDEESDTNDVWFANQTVDNACATNAMMNILMNAPSVELGETLKEFKKSTKTMSSPLRGHALSTNKVIRKVHNGFTRRLDHLNADLCLSSKAELAAKRTKRTKGKKLKGRVSTDRGYHFIAYVPVNGHVWELDGLKSRPIKLDPVTTEDWALDALPTIWSRMEDYGGGFEFNLLAMCQSPLRNLCREVAANDRVLELIERRLEDFPGGSPEKNRRPELPAPGKFPEYCVTPEMVSEAVIPENIRPLLSLLNAIPHANKPEGASALDLSSEVTVPRADLLRALHSALGAEPDLPAAESTTLTPADICGYLEALAVKTFVDQDDAVGRHVAEVGALSTDLERVEGRKKDYAPAIHAWMKILAEKGILEQIAA